MIFGLPRDMKHIIGRQSINPTHLRHKAKKLNTKLENVLPHRVDQLPELFLRSPQCHRYMCPGPRTKLQIHRCNKIANMRPDVSTQSNDSREKSIINQEK